MGRPRQSWEPMGAASESRPAGPSMPLQSPFFLLSSASVKSLFVFFANFQKQTHSPGAQRDLGERAGMAEVGSVNSPSSFVSIPRTPLPSPPGSCPIRPPHPSPFPSALALCLAAGFPSPSQLVSPLPPLTVALHTGSPAPAAFRNYALELTSDLLITRPPSQPLSCLRHTPVTVVVVRTRTLPPSSSEGSVPGPCHMYSL